MLTEAVVPGVRITEGASYEELDNTDCVDAWS